MPSQPFAFAVSSQAVTHPPASFEYFTDRCFRALAWAAAALVIVLVAYILWKIGRQALPAIHKYHFGFLISSQYNVQELKFGILPGIWGTLYSSLLALLIGGFFGLTVAIFLTQGFLPARLAFVFRLV